MHSITRDSNNKGHNGHVGNLTKEVDQNSFVKVHQRSGYDAKCIRFTRTGGTY